MWGNVFVLPVRDWQRANNRYNGHRQGEGENWILEGRGFSKNCKAEWRILERMWRTVSVLTVRGCQRAINIQDGHRQGQEGKMNVWRTCIERALNEREGVEWGLLIGAGNKIMTNRMNSDREWRKIYCMRGRELTKSELANGLDEVGGRGPVTGRWKGLVMD